MIAATQHDRHVTSDYALLRSLDIKTARDALRWPSIDRDGHYDREMDDSVPFYVPAGK